MSKVLPLFAAVLSLSAASAAMASDARMTGQQLLSLCTANMGGRGNPMEAAECLGFVVGVADTFDCTEDNHGYRWNSSADVSQPQLANLTVHYIESHPTTLSGEAHKAIGAALQQAYPCKPKSASN